MGQEGTKWFPTRQKDSPEGRAVTAYLGLGLPPSCRHPLLPLAGSQLEEGASLRRRAWGRREAVKLRGHWECPQPPGPHLAHTHAPGSQEHRLKHSRPFSTAGRSCSQHRLLPRSQEAPSQETVKGTRSCGAPAMCQKLAGEQSERVLPGVLRSSREDRPTQSPA